MISVKIRRKDELFSSLEKSVPTIQAELKPAMAEGAEQMVAKAKSFVPVDKAVAKRSIEWSWTKNTQENQRRSPALVVMAGADDVGDEGFYVRWIEFGTPNSPSQPFFFPAYRLTRRSIRSRMTRAMTKAIKKSGFGGK